MTKPITSAKLRVYRDRLHQQRAELEREAEHTRDDRKTVELDQQSTGRLTRMDALQNQAMANATQSRRLAAITKIDQALKRLGEGEFGYCGECGEDIEVSRLEFDPSISTCQTCATG